MNYEEERQKREMEPTGKELVLFNDEAGTREEPGRGRTGEKKERRLEMLDAREQGATSGEQDRKAASGRKTSKSKKNIQSWEELEELLLQKGIQVVKELGLARMAGGLASVGILMAALTQSKGTLSAVRQYYDQSFAPAAVQVQGVVQVVDQITGRATARFHNEIKELLLQGKEVNAEFPKEQLQDLIRAQQQQTKMWLKTMNALSRRPSLGVGVRGGGGILNKARFGQRRVSEDGDRPSAAFDRFLTQQGWSMHTVVEIYFDYRIPIWTPGGWEHLMENELAEEREKATEAPEKRQDKGDREDK